MMVKKLMHLKMRKQKNIIEYTSKIIILSLPENFENKVNGTVKIIKNNINDLEKLNGTYNNLNQQKTNQDDIGDLIDYTID